MSRIKHRVLSMQSDYRKASAATRCPCTIRSGGAKFQGQLASDPMYDLLRDAPRVARPLPFVLGAALLRRIKARRLSAACAVSTATLVTLSTLTSGHFAMWSMLAAGLFNSILFPAILSLGVADLGCVTGNESGILNMAIVGRAILPPMQGATSDHVGIHYAFFVSVIC